MTGFARFVTRNLDRCFHALCRLGEGDLEVVAEIGAALRPAAAAPPPEAEEVADAAEDVVELGEDRRIESSGTARGAGHGCVAEPIVARALIRVGQHRIRLGRLLERVLGGLIARIAVGMILQRELAIRALDFLLPCVATDTEDRVVVSLAHDAFATFTSDGRRSRSPSL